MLTFIFFVAGMRFLTCICWQTRWTQKNIGCCWRQLSSFGALDLRVLWFWCATIFFSCTLFMFSSSYLSFWPCTGRDDSLNSSTCIEMVNGCPNLMSLALRGFKLHDHKIRILIKVVTFSFSINLFDFCFLKIYLDTLP